MFQRLAPLVIPLLLLSKPVAAEVWLPIARIADPPPPVDGSLKRTAEVASRWSWSRPTQVVSGAKHWEGAADLSGELMVGWDENFLYLAARVRDDRFVPPFYGSFLPRGDHLALLLDLPRQPSGARDKTKVYRIVLHPGNLPSGSDVVGGEVAQLTPAAGTIAGARIASQPTADGYAVEAAIPWKHFAIDTPDDGLHFGMEVGLIDSDTPGEGGLETVMALLEAGWAWRDPDRMLEVALGNTSGKLDPSTIKAAFVAIAEDVQVQRGQDVDITLAAADGRPIVELIVRARLDFRQLAGGTGVMKVSLNGTELTQEHVRNRLATFQMGTAEQTTYRGQGWFVLYAPNYDVPDPFSPYCVRGIQPYEFRFGVADLWKADGGNVVNIAHVQPQAPADLVVNVGVSETLSTKLTPPPLKPAPTGEIPVFEPWAAAKPDYRGTIVGDGGIEVALGDRLWTVQSDFSTVAPGWVSMGAERGAGGWQEIDVGRTHVAALARDFGVRRAVQHRDDHIHVADTITNRTAADLPVMVRHHLDMGDGVPAVYICGREAATPKGLSDEPEHPTSLGLYRDAAIALVSEDDVTRALARNFRDGTVIGVDNNRLVVRAGQSLTIEFSIYPVEVADRFAFLNRVRANWGVNFTIPGSFCFISPGPPISDYNDDEFAAYFDHKSARITGVGVGTHRGLAAHGSGYFPADKSAEIALVKRVRDLRPRTETVVYLHTFISVGEDDAQRFAADILRRPDGLPGDYSSPLYPIFVPREGSPFAQLQDELIAARRRDYAITGIYWDEMAYSAHKFDYSDQHWDGYTADIDPGTHRILRKISSVTLATLSWRTRAAKSIMDRGLLIGNGAPHTRTFTSLHFPRFIETGSITNLTRSQLYTPIALGDHLTEHSALDCYRNMVKALDFGAVYYWYYYRVEPFDEPTLTEYMFPITYIRMGEGFVIGEERILTNRSGLFGWGDASEFDAVVFGRDGKRAHDVEIARVVKEGKTYAEVRIPEGYSVALIRALKAVLGEQRRPTAGGRRVLGLLQHPRNHPGEP